MLGGPEVARSVAEKDMRLGVRECARVVLNISSKDAGSVCASCASETQTHIHIHTSTVYQCSFTAAAARMRGHQALLTTLALTAQRQPPAMSVRLVRSCRMDAISDAERLLAEYDANHRAASSMAWTEMVCRST